MPIPAPESDEIAVGLHGIRAPRPSMRAHKLAGALQRLAGDVGTALVDAGVPAAVNGTAIVAPSSSARDSQTGVPTTSTARLALQNSGIQVYRTDKAWTERYFASKTDGGSNPAGKTVAGWYPVAGGLPDPVTYEQIPSTDVSSTTWANHPGSSDFTLVLPAPALVQVILSATIGGGTSYTAANWGAAGVLLSGALSDAPRAHEGVVGLNAGVNHGASHVKTHLVPAGTLTMRARSYVSGGTVGIRNLRIEAVPLRWL